MGADDRIVNRIVVGGSLCGILTAQQILTVSRHVGLDQRMRMAEASLEAVYHRWLPVVDV